MVGCEGCIIGVGDFGDDYGDFCVCGYVYLCVGRVGGFDGLDDLVYFVVGIGVYEVCIISWLVFVYEYIVVGCCLVLEFFGDERYDWV